MIDDLDDILNDEALFENFETDRTLFSTKRYQGTVRARSKSSSRQRVQTGFDTYRKLFTQVHADIACGKRQIKSIEETSQGNRISQKNPIKQGNFYVDNGIMLYVVKIYDPQTNVEVGQSTNRKYKVHIVYENGTENHVWLLSLISSLYDKKRSGRLVTEPLDTISMLGEETTQYHTTGYIYVVKYAGTDNRFLELDNLYKIGVATDIKKRLSNSQNEATYLYAPVYLVASYEIQNVSANKLEKYLHDAFSDKRVQLETISPTGKKVSVNEWFVVELEQIEQKINELFKQLNL
ncbi:YeeC-like protein [Streptococcus suis]|uniref:YeeC-like protein n=1 Tax=Streptococcus suis TaxID=1307 RepID=A0A0Z8EDH2_STRSU|nr:GIY-YIG nuclease family protein [Streptococcus suis]NQH39562.1 GIY-YIG nuclease family protein [Streptococcus suis]CYU60049.1 YeeC-like protein [Streptococcus suis]